ncbi:uncharacterized mitochondrial protein AtMg00810-like [Rutidosis leptorrhynchoides]|uniref:uncharacterized mitochondrial protein AtMg00810-like n=1 Tax=Rutidosis leptorrhynchoides TaxID=125765 RepID=UPI003A99572A
MTAAAAFFEYACHISKIESKTTREALKHIEWVDAMQEEIQLEAIRILLAFASYMKFKVYQMDVNSAFLYGKLNERVYVTQPPCFEDHLHLDKVSVEESPLWIASSPASLFYVDDIIFSSTNQELVDEFEQVMKDEFEMSKLGLLHYFLGLQVEQTDDGIFCHQAKYVNDILTRFSMTHEQPAFTPLAVNYGISLDCEGVPVKPSYYRAIIGSLMYLTASQQDIMFATCLCARYQVKPNTVHLTAAKRILCYLLHTLTLGIWFSNKQDFNLKAYCDSDYAGCKINNKSTSGGCQFLGEQLVTW